jgi:two-component system sensor histidine kinase DesK
VRWAARLGGVFGFGWLVLLWPVLGAFFHLHLPGLQVAALAAAIVLYAAVYAYYCFWGYRRRDRSFVLATVASLSLLAIAINELSTIKTLNPYIIPLLVAGFGRRPRRAVVPIAGITVVGMTEALIGRALSAQETLVAIALFLPQVLLFTLAAMGLRYLLEVQAELRAARSQVARLAVEEERARISRDLHDLLGHSLSLITMKGALASRAVPEDEPGGVEVREMVRLARDALREVRDVVSSYRQPTIAAELSAARTALQAAGIRLDVEQSVGALSRETEAVLGWTIREGVTNVIRHSGASHCAIVLAREDGLVRADVVDDGAGPASSNGGTGLQGLKERVTAIGGHLEAGRAPARGFKLSITAPVAGS